MISINTKTGVCFFRVESEATLVQWLSQQSLPGLDVDMNLGNLQGWLSFGCIYLDGQRIQKDVLVRSGQVLRLHTRPKRYVVPTEGLNRSVVLNEKEFLVVDKPCGLPVHATLDNAVENVKTQLEKELDQTLYTTHRLDIPTAGLLILAKTKDAQILINRLFAEKRVSKIYQATTNRKPLPAREYIHYINPDGHVPRQISETFQLGWWECRMEVLSVRTEKENFEHCIRLITGKTHQIRAQMQALGASILGDQLYGGDTAAQLALSCESLAFRFRGTDFSIVRNP